MIRETVRFVNSTQPANNRWARFWSRPPGVVLLACTLVLCGLTLWAYSWPTPNGWILSLAVFWPAVAVGMCWAIRAAVCLSNTRQFHFRMLWVPLVGAVSLGLIFLSVPLHARWQLSVSEFESAVQRIQSEPDTDIGGPLGTYTVRNVRKHGDNLYFVIEDSGFIDDDGVAYLPHGEPATPDPVGEGVQVGHIRGDWYWFSAGW